MDKLIVPIAIVLAVGVTVFGLGGAKDVQAETPDSCITDYHCAF
jgi:hypothetical protein